MKTPQAYIGRCPSCNVIRGTVDFARTDPKESGSIIRMWISRCWILEPRIGDFSCQFSLCYCTDEEITKAIKELPNDLQLNEQAKTN